MVVDSNSGTTDFTRRIGTFKFSQTTPTNGYTSLVNNWHKNVFNQRDVDYHFEKGGTEHEPTWEAIPTIMGEKHLQFIGSGTSKAKAKEDSAQKIASSGHC
ncbi:hypothetical protein FRC07_003886 [Ceratobasidium sp. 392]|nr:hypothetical protein FRC07_003886 [Ceratobasidium sp. 392]